VKGWLVGPKPSIRYRGKRHVVEAWLTNAILTGTLPAGKWLRQSEVAVLCGTSQTPVREALRALEAKSLVVYEPHRGVRVAEYAEYIEQFLSLCEVLEGLATELAVRQLRPSTITVLARALSDMEGASARGDAMALRAAHSKFHITLYRGSRFPFLVGILEAAWAQFPWDGFLALPSHRALSLADHRGILETVRARDSLGAAEVVRRHARELRDLLHVENSVGVDSAHR